MVAGNSAVRAVANLPRRRTEGIPGARQAAVGAGSGTAAQSIVAWLTLPLLVWFLYLTTLAILAVFDVTPFAAVALAMLPDAVLLLVLIVLLVATGR